MSNEAAGVRNKIKGEQRDAIRTSIDTEGENETRASTEAMLSNEIHSQG